MLKDFYNDQAGVISVSRQQGSTFAKEIANDFNPLHDIDSKRFCVPGDLLFAIVLKHYGVSESMSFSFLGMVTDTVSLKLPVPNDELLLIEGDKTYLSVKRKGAVINDVDVVDSLIRQYVAFSGKTFPHVIVPLMADQGVMINPLRPMVMYQSMSLTLSRTDIISPALEFTEPQFEFEGKRGNIVLPFDIKEAGEIIGRGEKHMIVSGIKSYDETAMNVLIDEYNTWQ